MKYFSIILILYCALPCGAQHKRQRPEALPRKAAADITAITKSADSLWHSSHVAQPAQFPGDWGKYVETHLEYPATGEDVEGRVWVQFIVRKEGTVTDAKVIKSLAPAYDAEALKLIRNMPCWVPGTANGVQVDSYYNVVLVFSLP